MSSSASTPVTNPEEPPAKRVKVEDGKGAGTNLSAQHAALKPEGGAGQAPAATVAPAAGSSFPAQPNQPGTIPTQSSAAPVAVQVQQGNTIASQAQARIL